MQYGLRDASQEKAAECPQASGTENDEVDVAAVRSLDDFPRRVALRNQSRDRTSSLREWRRRVRQQCVRVRALFTSILGGQLVQESVCLAHEGRSSHTPEARAGG